jgi:ribonuclease-3
VLEIVRLQFGDAIDRVGAAHSTDAKTELQELCQDRCRVTPVYRVVSQAGPDHARHFVVDVLLGERVLARGEGRSKRAAEQDAARHALREQMPGPVPEGGGGAQPVGGAAAPPTGCAVTRPTPGFRRTAGG